MIRNTSKRETKSSIRLIGTLDRDSNREDWLFFMEWEKESVEFYWILSEELGKKDVWVVSKELSGESRDSLSNHSWG